MDRILAFESSGGWRAPNRFEAEGFSALGSQPMIELDLAMPDAPYRLTSLGFTQAIIVGFDESGALPTGPFQRCDILLTTRKEPPRPWTSIANVRTTLDELRSCISLNPIAASICARILRIGETLSFEDSLTVESLAFSALLGGEEFRRWRENNPSRDRRRDEGPYVRITRDDEYVRVRLDRPKGRNAVCAAMRDELVEILINVLEDPSEPELLLHSNGPCFSAGGDLDEFGTARDLAAAHVIRTLRSPSMLLHALGARATVFIHGACIGAGIEMGAAAGVRVASMDASFRLPEVAMGLIPGAGGTASIPRVVGRQRASFMALTGNTIEAPLALAWGLIDRIGSCP
jgi:hypothetical protein